MKVNNLRNLLFLVLLLCITFFVVQTTVSAFSVKELLGLGDGKDRSEEQTESVKNTDAKSTREWSKTSPQSTLKNPQIDLAYLHLLVSNMPSGERRKALEDEKIFKQVIENEARNRSVVAAAIENKLYQDKNVAFVMRRKAENALRELYLSRLVSTKLSDSFPSTEQVADFYEKNKSQFVVPERVALWQIFHSKPEDKKEAEALKKKMSKLANKLKRKELDFSSVALTESTHEQSRVLGGYLGIIQTKDLLPEIKEAVMKVKEGEVSLLVESKTGFHIIKRGKIMGVESLKLSDVAPQIKEELIGQANIQLRKAIYTQASKDFPQDITDQKVEEWRLKLLSEINVSP